MPPARGCGGNASRVRSTAVGFVTLSEIAERHRGAPALGVRLIAEVRELCAQGSDGSYGTGRSRVEKFSSCARAHFNLDGLGFSVMIHSDSRPGTGRRCATAGVSLPSPGGLWKGDPTRWAGEERRR